MALRLADQQAASIWPSIAPFVIGAAGGLAGIAYVRAMLRRNAALVRPPVCDAGGRSLPVALAEYSDGETVEYIDTGPSEPDGTLVWIPGADGPKETFRYQLLRFSQRHRVICADLRRSFAPGDGLDRLAGDIRELVEARGVDRPFTLVGASLGSAIAMRYATLHPDRLCGLVLSNPLARVSRDHIGFNRNALIPVAMGATRYLPTRISRALARLWSRFGIWVFDDSAGRDALIDYVLYTGSRTVSAAVSTRRVDGLDGLDLRSDLRGIETPALIVKGVTDTYCPVSWAVEIAELLPAAEYAPIDGAGHCAHISRPEVFNDTLERWLRRTRTSRASSLGEQREQPAAAPEPAAASDATLGDVTRDL